MSCSTAPTRFLQRTITRSIPATSSRSTHRPISTTTTTSPNPKSTRSPPPLPPAKLRALISLYHQCETFITPQTLSSRIEEAFANPRLPSSSAIAEDQLNYQDLRYTVSKRRSLPRMCDVQELSNLNDEEYARSAGVVGVAGSGSWSDMKTMREQRLVDALYGVDVQPKHVMPGLEVLQDETSRVLEDIQREKEREAERVETN